MEENKVERPVMKMLPGDEVRQIMWRFAERYDIQMAIAGARQTARSVVARLVANGQRFTHEWTPEKQSLFDAFDASGMTAATLSFRKQDAASIRRYGLISSPCWLIYNIGVFSLGAIICEVLSLGSILIGMGRLDKQK